MSIEKTLDVEELIDIDVDVYDLREWADDIVYIRQALKTINIHTSHLMCYSFWVKYSSDMSAGWLQISENDVVREARRILRGK